jgi:hypothetical protein
MNLSRGFLCCHDKKQEGNPGRADCRLMKADVHRREGLHPMANDNPMEPSMLSVPSMPF